MLCTRLFAFFHLIVLSPSPCPPPTRRQYFTYFRSERDIKKHAAQRRAISSAQASLGIIVNSLFAPNNHGPLLPAPYTCFSCILPSASVAGGVSARGAEPYALFRTTQNTTRYEAKYQVPGTGSTCVYSSFCFRR